MYGHVHTKIQQDCGENKLTREKTNKQTNIPVVSLCRSVKQEAQNDCMDDNNDIENDKDKRYADNIKLS